MEKSSELPWWLLVGFVALMAGLLMLAHRLAASLGWREFLDVGILLFSYGLVTLGLGRNTSPTGPDPLERDETTLIVIESLIMRDQGSPQIPAALEFKE